MKRKKLGAVHCMLGLTFLFASSAYAEYPTDGFSLSPFVGGYKFDGAQDFRGRPIYGLRLGANMNENQALELTGGYIRTRHRDGDDPSKHRHIFRYSLDGIHRFAPQNSVVPFVAVGLGGMTFNDYRGSDNRSRFQANYGPGILVALNDNIALRGDLRHLILLDHDHYSNLEGTVGVSFSYGGSRASTPPAQEQPTAYHRPMGPLHQNRMGVKNVPLRDIHFEWDSAELTPDGRALLDQYAQVIRTNPKIHIIIQGRTSASGSAAYNQILSEKRAQAVKDYLQTHGNIYPDRLTAVGLGEHRPAKYEPNPDDEFTPEAKANMRANFVIDIKEDNQEVTQ